MFAGRLRSLVIQLLGLVILPTLFALIVVAYSGVSLHEHAMQSLIGEHDERAARAASEALADRFAQRQITLRLLANQIANGSSIAQIFDQTPDLRSVFDGGLVAVDSQAIIRDSWQPGPFWANDLRKTTALWVLQHDPQPTMVIANVQSSNHGLTLFGGISLDSLNLPDMMSIMKNDALTRLFLVADDGHIIADTQASTLGSLWKPIVAVADPHHPPDGVVRYDSQDNLVVSSTIKQLNWTLVIQEPWDEVINASLKTSLVAPLAMIPAILLAMGILAFGILAVVLPLYRLRRATGRIAWGDYTALHQSVGGIQEIRDLQTTLDQMAQRLQQAQAGIRSYIGAMLQGQEDERKRLARELHDDTLQALIALDQQRQMIQRALEHDPVKASDRLVQLGMMSQDTIQNLRRTIRNMRPTYLEDLGLVPALEMLSTQSAEISQIEIRFKVSGTQHRLTPNQELGLYRIAQESLANALHHAKATCIEVTLIYGNDTRLTIQDNGAGFIVPERPVTLGQNGHYGLMGMVERAEQIAAQFRIRSSPGKGTDIEVIVSNVNLQIGSFNFINEIGSTQTPSTTTSQ